MLIQYLCIFGPIPSSGPLLLRKPSAACGRRGHEGGMFCSKKVRLFQRSIKSSPRACCRLALPARTRLIQVGPPQNFSASTSGLTSPITDFFYLKKARHGCHHACPSFWAVRSFSSRRSLGQGEPCPADPFGAQGSTSWRNGGSRILTA